MTVLLKRMVRGNVTFSTIQYVFTLDIIILRNGTSD
jgi:hypothetical protein